MSDRICPADGCNRAVYVRGLCEPHYRQALPAIGRIKGVAPDVCRASGCEASPHAGGFCQFHYDRWRRRGDTSAGLLRVRGGRTCTVDGCAERANARGLCPVHYRRVQRTGEAGLAYERPEQRPCGYCTELFSSRRLSKLYCSDECVRTAKSLQGLHYRYGINMQDYRMLWLRQGGVCAICRQPERSERNRLLTIDHDHMSGQVRGLLCSHCNRAIGLMQDDPKVIEAAAKYVRENHQLRLVL